MWVVTLPILALRGLGADQRSLPQESTLLSASTCIRHATFSLRLPVLMLRSYARLGELVNFTTVLTGLCHAPEQC